MKFILHNPFSILATIFIIVAEVENGCRSYEYECPLVAAERTDLLRIVEAEHACGCSACYVETRYSVWNICSEASDHDD